MAMLTSQPTDMPWRTSRMTLRRSWTRSAYNRPSCSDPPAVATSRNRSLYKCLIASKGWSLLGAPRSLQGRPAFAGEVDRLTDPVDPTWVEESLTWFPRYQHVPDWYIKDRIHDGVRVPAHVWIAGLTGLTTAVPPSESATITAPTLIIWGEHDELLPPQDGHLLAAAIPGSRLSVYQDTGHLVLWEQPERVASDLAEFVAGLLTSDENSAPLS